MPDNNNIKIGLEVDPGASKANIEQGIVAPLRDVKLAGEDVAKSVTPALQQVAQETNAVAGAEKQLSQAADQVVTETEREAAVLKELATAAATAEAEIKAAAASETEAITELAPAAEGAARGITEAAGGTVAALNAVGEEALASSAAISEGAAAGAESLAGVTPAATEAASAVAGIGESATAASEEATTALGETTAAIKETAAAAQEIGPVISEGFREVGDQTQLVQNAIDTFYQRLADGLAPGRGALRQISAQYSLLGEQIAEAEGLTADEAAAAQSNYQRIGAAIQGVITRQREFNVELKATQFATKEGGVQFALLGIAAEQTGKYFGEAGAEIGKTAGELGLLAAILPRLTIMLKGLGPALTAPFVAGLGPIAALIAAFAGFFAIGTKIAETNELNTQSFNDLKKSIGDLISGGGEFGAWVGKIQAELQVLISDLLDSGQAVAELVDALNSGDSARAAAAIAQISAQYHNLGHELDAATKAQDKERLSARAAEEAHKELGKSTHDLGGEIHTANDDFGKLNESTSKLSKTTQFYVETQKLGIAGQRLWNQAVDAANGSEQKLAEIIEKLHPQFEKLIEDYRKAKAAVDLQLDGIKKQIEEEKKLIETEAEESRRIQQLVADIGTEEAARKKLHATVQGEIEDAAKLDTASGGTSKSIQDTAKWIAELTDRYEEEQPEIDNLIAKLTELEKSTVGLSAETKKYIDEIAEEKKSIDDLTQKNKELQKEEDALVAKGNELTKSDLDRIQAIDHEIVSNQTAIRQAKDKIAADAQLLQGQQEVIKGTIEITGANGRAVDSQHKLTKSTQDQTKATKDAGEGLSDLAKTVHLNAEKAKELSDASKGITVSVKDAGDSGASALNQFKELGDGLDDVSKHAKITNDDLIKVGKGITEGADKSKDATTLFKKVAQEMQEEWKKSGIVVDDHTKKIEELTVQYKTMRDTAVKAINDIIAVTLKLDAVTKKTAGGDSGGGSSGSSPSSGSSQYPAPIGPQQPASDSGGGNSGHS